MSARPARQPAPAPDDALLDARGAMAYLGVSRTFLTDHLAALGGIKMGDGPKARLRFRRSSLDAFLDRHQARPEAVSPTPLDNERERRRPVLKHTSPVNPLDGKAW